MNTHTLIILCAIASSASAATYHVAQNVSSACDANPGTSQKPWLTLETRAAD